MNSFSIPHPGYFMRDNVIYSHVGLLTIQDSEAMVLVAIMGSIDEEAALFHAQLWLMGQSET